MGTMAWPEANFSSSSFSLAPTTPGYDVQCVVRDHLLHLRPLRIVISFLYFVVFLVSLSGNMLVAYVVVRRPHMRTVTNIFIMNLACSDLLVASTSLWVTPAYTFIGYWVWGELMCHGLPLFQGASIFNSSLTLMAIAIDRYVVIVHYSNTLNINDRMSKKMCFMIIMLIWTISVALVAPLAINMRLIRIRDPCNFSICSEHWQAKHIRTIYGLAVMLLQFVLPVLIIGVSYRLIWHFISARRWSSERLAEARRKQRLLAMILTMVFLFVVCWFPFNVLNVLRDIKMDNWMIKTHFPTFFLFSHLISMTATCANPILYSWMNETFRDEFMRTLPWLKACPCFSRAEQARSSTSGSVSGHGKRVQMITECKPWQKRNNSTEVVRSRCLSQPSETGESVLLTQDADETQTQI